MYIYIYTSITTGCRSLFHPMFQAHLTIRATTPLSKWLMGRNSSDHKSPFSGTMPGP